MDKTGVANLAIRKIGANRISSFTDGSREGDLILDVYDAIRDEVLEAFPWSFATTTVPIQKLAIVPNSAVENLTIAYGLPNDFIRPVAVSNIGATFKFESFKNPDNTMTKMILSDMANLQLKYVFRNDDPSSYSPSFVTAFATRLGAEIGFNIAQAAKKAQLLLEEYENVRLPDAKSRDSGGTPEQPAQSEWETARLMGGGSFLDVGKLWIPINW